MWLRCSRTVELGPLSSWRRPSSTIAINPDLKGDSVSGPTHKENARIITTEAGHGFSHPDRKSAHSYTSLLGHTAGQQQKRRQDCSEWPNRKVPESRPRSGTRVCVADSVRSFRRTTGVGLIGQLSHLKILEDRQG